MSSKTVLLSLSSTQRQLVRRQWQQSGQCIRCFHASIRRRAEDPPGQQDQRYNSNNDKRTPYNQPQRGPSRQQRAAQISEEVRLLNRDVPSFGPSKPQNEESYAVGPQGSADLNTPGRMGENASPGREGPFAQGVGRTASSRRDEGMGADNEAIRGIRTPDHGVEDPDRGGETVLEASQGSTTADASSRSLDGQPTNVASRRKPTMKSPGSHFQPSPVSYKDLVQSGNQSSTIAANNFEGTINDHVRLAAEPGEFASRRDINTIAQRQLAGQIVRLDSLEEKKAVHDKVKEIKRFDREVTAQASEVEKQAQVGKRGGKKPNTELSPLPDTIKTMLINKLVKGVYDQEGVLGGAQKHKQPVLDRLAKMGILNGTYLASDSERFLKKVESLLPAAPVQASRQGAAGVKSAGGAGTGPSGSAQKSGSVQRQGQQMPGQLAGDRKASSSRRGAATP
ncbi:hypothetical protein LTR86_003965 [Recurvomyces mirabilis]|nr:hypothetical protein LTR86_003965 [Recurvomyces mirabilis]